MCFQVDLNHPDPLVAEEDIPCIKVINDDFTSFFKNYPYKLGEINPKEELKEIINLAPSVNYINEGYHSYYYTIQVYFPTSSSYLWVKCIIPKGTKYYKNDNTQEYVSETIIIEKVLKTFIKEEIEFIR